MHMLLKQKGLASLGPCDNSSTCHISKSIESRALILLLSVSSSDPGLLKRMLYQCSTLTGLFEIWHEDEMNLQDDTIRKKG